MAKFTIFATKLKPSMKTLTAINVSEYLLKLSGDNEHNDMTNLKLQKLLYYIQGTSLVLQGQRMFNEDIVKWQYGPVVPDVYHHYKQHGSSFITPSSDSDINIPTEFVKIINDVYGFFGKYNAITLMHYTHNEKPWIETEMGHVIEDKLLVDFFKTIIIDD